MQGDSKDEAAPAEKANSSSADAPVLESGKSVSVSESQTVRRRHPPQSHAALRVRPGAARRG